MKRYQFYLMLISFALAPIFLCALCAFARPWTFSPDMSKHLITILPFIAIPGGLGYLVGFTLLLERLIRPFFPERQHI